MCLSCATTSARTPGAYSNGVKKGRVISQKPKPSTLLPNHGKLRLVVSRGRKP